MKYTISVSNDGRPLFNTGELDFAQAKAVLTLFYAKFPRSEGYECVCYDDRRPLHEGEVLDFAVRQANPAGPDPLALEECPYCKQMKPRGREMSCCEDCYREKFAD